MKDCRRLKSALLSARLGNPAHLFDRVGSEVSFDRSSCCAASRALSLK